MIVHFLLVSRTASADGSIHVPRGADCRVLVLGRHRPVLWLVRTRAQARYAHRCRSLATSVVVRSHSIIVNSRGVLLLLHDVQRLRVGAADRLLATAHHVRHRHHQCHRGNANLQRLPSGDSSRAHHQVRTPPPTHMTLLYIG